MGDFASRRARAARSKIKDAFTEEVYAVRMSASRIQELLERREAIAREIARHPRPITGCDVHFNRLLEERAAISEEIDRLERLQAPRTKPTISFPLASSLRAPIPEMPRSVSSDDGRMRAISRSVASWKMT